MLPCKIKYTNKSPNSEENKLKYDLIIMFLALESLLINLPTSLQIICHSELASVIYHSKPKLNIIYSYKIRFIIKAKLAVNQI